MEPGGQMLGNFKYSIPIVDALTAVELDNDTCILFGVKDAT